MEKESVFELIRKEEMILFAGAGMSLYAGFPSGKELAKIFHENLPTNEQNEIDLSSDLLQVSEDIFNIKNGNKNYLIAKLKECFEIEPSSKETHQLLAKIPQIKTIITTNYDTLFEDTNKNLEVILRSSDYPIANPKKPQLFKIHGDLSDTKNIILTKSDYNKFFIENKDESVFWTAVKDRLASNHILFIGYSLEDNNVMVMFERILSELGENRKELFFAAPSISSPKKKFLDRKGINFIESTGENLISEIFEDLKLNYIPELAGGNGNADTAFNFGISNNISLDLSKNDGKIIVQNAKSVKGIGENKINFSLELTDEKREGIIQSLQGKNFDDVILDSETIKKISHYFNGFRISNGKDIHKIWIKKLPSIEGNFDIIFEDEYELDNYKMQIFIIQPKENEYHIKIMVKDFFVIIEISRDDIADNVNYFIQVHPNNFVSSVKSGLNFYNIASRIVDNKSFSLYKNEKLFYDYSSLHQFIGDPFDAKYLYDYFQKLKKIQTFFNVRFKNINLDDINEKSIEEIIAFIDKRFLKVKFNSFEFDYVKKTELNNLIEASKDKFDFIMSEEIKSTYLLHGINFETGYLNQIISDGYIVNKDDLINNISSRVELKSKSDTIQFYFSDEKDIFLKQ